jgi:hypothetical protein
VGVFAPVLGGVIWALDPDLLWWINACQWGFIVFPLMIMLMEKKQVGAHTGSLR